MAMDILNPRLSDGGLRLWDIKITGNGVVSTTFSKILETENAKRQISAIGKMYKEQS